MRDSLRYTLAALPALALAQSSGEVIPITINGVYPGPSL